MIAWLKNPLPRTPLKSEDIGTKDMDIALGYCDTVESHFWWLCPTSKPPRRIRMLNKSWSKLTNRLFRFILPVHAIPLFNINIRYLSWISISLHHFWKEKQQVILASLKTVHWDPNLKIFPPVTKIEISGRERICSVWRSSEH